MHEAQRLLIAYDGSPNGTPAVRAAASLFPGARASVAAVPHDPITRAGAGAAMMAPAAPDLLADTIEQLGTEARQEADEIAGQGVEQGRTLGLDAELADVPPSAPAWAALLDAAHRLGSDLLICGTRGRGTFARALLGSTSSSLLHNTDVPLLIVPDGGGALDGPVVAAYD